ncbi:MAG: hypothetical protein K6G48_05870 [Acholeplasmatales bacterium]|nr:hypothetical protein [Acholeplasmatales bacterium]
MNIERSRIIVEFNDSDYKVQLEGFKNINIIYESKEKYALVYCNRSDEKKIVELLSKTCRRAYVSNEKVDAYNF